MLKLRCARWISMLALCLPLLLTGCWDRMEINDIAFVMASSNDIAENGELLSATKIAVPSGLGSGRNMGQTSGVNQSFIIESASGRDINDLIQKLQGKLPRRLNISHRRVLYIGEKLAKRGIAPILDHYSRNPTSRHIEYILVTKGRESIHFLKSNNPLERIPGEEVRELERLNTGAVYSLRDYLIEDNSAGRTPVMGVVEMSGSKGREEIMLGGSAMFKKDKLIGYLSHDETKVMLLLTNRIKYFRINSNVPKERGNVAMQLIKGKCKIKPIVKRDDVKFLVEVQIIGEVLENNTKLDLSEPPDLEKVQEALRNEIQKKVQKAVANIQKKYRADVFGFGESIFYKEPKVWKRLEPRWEGIFARAEVTVKTQLTIRNAGMNGKPFHLKEKGGK